MVFSLWNYDRIADRENSIDRNKGSRANLEYRLNFICTRETFTRYGLVRSGRYEREMNLEERESEIDICIYIVFEIS